VLLYGVPEVKPATASASGRRARRALDTRRRIRSAARQLFVKQGYGATTIQQIAEKADVAWQTVYSVFGTKAAILSEIFDVAVAGDDDPIPMAERPFVRHIADARDPRDKARILAAHLRDTNARTADIQTVIESAADADADTAALWNTLMEQLIRGMTMAATALRQQHALRADLTIEQAADRLWWYAGPWAYRGLVMTRGWSLDEFEDWLAETLYTQLMTPPPAARTR
jgi:TetR/AcrR family transcriptional regulator, regulator of autoinduction and epiphytic fitness